MLIILFDGVCNLCSSSVQFVIRHDSKALFHFAALQSEKGNELLQKHQLPTNNYNSFVLIEGDRAYTLSTAALRVTRKLDWPWKAAYVFIMVPRFLRDAVYRIIANNRYSWFGKQNSCWVPAPSLMKRFL